MKPAKFPEVPCLYHCPKCGKREWNQMYMPDVDPLRWCCLRCGMKEREVRECVHKEVKDGI